MTVTEPEFLKVHTRHMELVMPDGTAYDAFVDFIAGTVTLIRKADGMLTERREVYPLTDEQTLPAYLRAATFTLLEEEYEDGKKVVFP